MSIVVITISVIIILVVFVCFFIVRPISIVLRIPTGFKSDASRFQWEYYPSPGAGINYFENCAVLKISLGGNGPAEY